MFSKQQNIYNKGAQKLHITLHYVRATHTHIPWIHKYVMVGWLYTGHRNISMNASLS